MFATVLKSAPLFNCKELSRAFLNYDSVYLVREIETVLFPGTVLKIHRDDVSVFEVTTQEYFSEKPLYIDKRFVAQCDTKPNERIKVLPTANQMLQTLANLPKLPYIWGGNIFQGIPELLQYYPPKHPLTTFDYMYWQLKGVDCSGLLYALTNGYTLRNTSQIYHIYPQVTTLKPLDVIVWPGHNLIVLSPSKVIECRQYDGLVVSDITTRLKQIEHHNPRYVRFL